MMTERQWRFALTAAPWVFLGIGAYICPASAVCCCLAFALWHFKEAIFDLLGMRKK